MINVQKSPEWIAEYYKTIGASNAAAACGISPWMSRSKLGEIMLGIREPDDLSDNMDVQFGTFCEPFALQMLSEKIGLPIEPHDPNEFLYSEKYPFAHVLPDGWALDGNKRIPCEVKVVRASTYAKMEREGGPSNERFIQCQTAAAITDAPYTIFGAFDRAYLRIYDERIERDDALIKTFMEAMGEFHAEVKAGRVPGDGSVVPYKAPSLDRKIITDPKAIRDSRDWLRLKKLEGETEDSLQELREVIEGHIGDARVFRFEGVADGQHTPTKGRTTFNHKAAVKADPALKKFYVTGNPSMRLTINALRK